MNQDKQIHTKQHVPELIRLKNAFMFSIDGLRAGYATQQALRTETLFLVASIVLAIFLPVSLLEKVALVASVLFVMIVELLNSAIEVAIDRISLDIHPLSKVAKDMGSAAVLFAFIVAFLVWAAILFPFIKTWFA